MALRGSLYMVEQTGMAGAHSRHGPAVVCAVSPRLPQANDVRALLEQMQAVVDQMPRRRVAY